MIAEKRASRLRARNYACPLILGEGDQKFTWFQWRERGLDVLLKLAREEYFDIRSDKDGSQAFKTIWYKSKYPELPIDDIDSRHAGHRQAFIARRTAIECPPNTYVEQGGSNKRRLHFLDHGCSLHDQIVTAICSRPIATDFTTEFTVEYPAEHPILALEGRRLLVASATLDLSRALSPDLEAVVGAVDPTASKAEQDARASTLRHLEAALAADRRWLLDRCPPEFIVRVFVEEGGGFTAVPVAAAAILDSSHARQRGRQLGRRRSTLAETALVQARKAAQQDLQKRGFEALNRALLAVRVGAEHRAFAINVDNEAQIAAARAELASAEKLDQKLVFNQAAVRGASLAVRLAEAAGTARRAWLAGAATAVEKQAALGKTRYFWVMPKKMTEERQAIPQGHSALLHRRATTRE